MALRAAVVPVYNSFAAQIQLCWGASVFDCIWYLQVFLVLNSANSCSIKRDILRDLLSKEQSR